MAVTRNWRIIIIWLVVSAIAALFCSLNRQEAHIGSEFFPMGNDAFYHAHRILITVEDPNAFYQFDPNIHAPEGSVLVWPWGYDYALAQIVRLSRAIGLGSDPLMILLWIPVVAVGIAIGLVLLVARRLSLSDWGVALAGLCMALSPGTQLLFGFGQIDHHFGELLFILASLAAGLAWFKSSTPMSGVALGATFGLALAVHNALFVIQIPFLAALFARWVQGFEPSPLASGSFAAALIASTLAVLIPSLPFQEGLFEFYTLSWFHLYIACCSSVIVLILARIRFSRRSLVAILAIGVALILPLVGQIRHAQSFVSGSIGVLELILEMRSPFRLIRTGDATMVTNFYSWLIWIAPLTFVLCCVQIWRERQRDRLYFWIACVFGLSLASTQIRMHYFGSFALYLPFLVMAQHYAATRPALHKRVYLITTLLFLLAYIPQIRHSLVAPMYRANDQWFASLYPMLPALKKACADDPGVVLADGNAGHYITYFTRCSVIANNFLLTEQQFRKYDEMLELLSRPLSELRERAPFVKYVLVRAGRVEARDNGQFRYHFFGAKQPQTTNTLLLGSAQAVPPEFKLLFETQMQIESGGRLRLIPYAKLYKVEPIATSGNDVTK